MSMYQGAYVGVGYIVDANQKAELLSKVENHDRLNQIIDNFHPIDGDREYFFGEVIYTIPSGHAASVETLAALPGLTDDGSFGIKYGSMLYDMGIPVEEINTTWGKPNIYIVHWEDC